MSASISHTILSFGDVSTYTSILCCLHFVCISLSWSDGALGDSRYTVVLRVVELTQSMPVDGSAIGRQLIGDMNNQVTVNSLVLQS